jgi:hypothetical protein
MGFSQVAYSYSAVSYYEKPERRVSPQNVIGGAALAFVSLTCLGMLAVNLFGNDDAAAAMDDAGAEIVTIAPPRTLEMGGVFASLLSSTYSFGGPRVTFEVPALAKGDKLEVAALAKGDRLAVRTIPEHLALLEVPPPDELQQGNSQTAPSLKDAPLANAQPTQTMQVVANIPLPPPRPVIEPVQSRAPSVRDIAQANTPAMLANAAPKPSKPLTIFEKLFGKRDQPEKTQLAYASTDGGVTGSIPTNTNDIAAGMVPPYDRQTAVYDITARTVYLPDGTRLEAHSGLGDRLDDPRSMRERMRGVTPPHVYDLKLRESLFHGVEALRLNPVGGEDAIFGRTGLLAHTYMLGPNGDSNGCVSFRDYNRFLRAYKSGEIKRLVVVAKVD